MEELVIGLTKIVFLLIFQIFLLCKTNAYLYWNIGDNMVILVAKRKKARNGLVTGFLY